MAENEIEIAWYGQAMFLISGEGIKIVVDPTSPDTGYIYDPVAADLLLVTHSHFDHNHTSGVTGAKKTIRTSGTHVYNGITVTGLDTFHDASGGKQRGPNIIYAWEQAGFSIAHLGDLGERSISKYAEKLSGLDLLMIPVGGVFTIDGKEAANLVAELSPKIAIPMHYNTPDCTIGLERIDVFLNNFKGEVKNISERPISVKRESLPTKTEAWVLPYK